MDGKSVRLSSAQRRDLERLFVTTRGGRRTLLAHVTTISTVTRLWRLHCLQQMGLLMYAEIPDFYPRFGVLGWHCRLTACAKEALERELAREVQ
jgi:hypothetical protein